MFKNMMQLAKKTAFVSKSKINPNKHFTSKLNNDNFLNGSSRIYIEKLQEQWKKDPKSVHVSWDIYFSSLEKGFDFDSAFQSPPSIDKGNNNKLTNKT